MLWLNFICNDYIDLSGTRVDRELQHEKFLSIVGFDPGTFRLRSEGATTGATRTHVCGVDVVTAIFFFF